MKIGIAGAGLLGQLLGCLLQKKGYDITLITESDRTAKGSAAYAAAGMLVPLLEVEHANADLYYLGQRSIERWKKLLPTFSKAIDYQFAGSIVTAHPQDRSILTGLIDRIQSKVNQQIIKTIQPISLNDFETDLSPQKGFFFPMDGYIGSRSLLQAMAYELTINKATWHIHTRVTDIKPGIITAQKTHYKFDCVFDCRGYTAKDAFPELRGVRGELLYLHAPEVRLTRPIRLLTPRYPLYIVPLKNNQYIIGASQIETEDPSSVSVRTCLELLTAAYSLHSGFAEARIIDSVVGLRPALGSNLPRIKAQPGLIAINGLYRHGFLIAPAMVDDAISLFESGEHT